MTTSTAPTVNTPSTENHTEAETQPQEAEAVVPAKRKPRVLDIHPQIRFVANGDLLVSKEDVYPTLDRLGNDESLLDEYHGYGGEAVFFSAGSDMLVVDQAQYIMNGKANIKVKVLCGEQVGWVAISEISCAKEWDWMIPPKRAKVVKDRFKNLFDIKLQA